MTRAAALASLVVIAVAGCGQQQAGRPPSTRVLRAAGVDVLVAPHPLSRQERQQAHRLLRTMAGDCAAMRVAAHAHDTRRAGRLIATSLSPGNAFIRLYDASPSQLRDAALA